MQKFNQLFLAFLTIATFITCTSTAKQRPEGGWLWKISGNGLSHPSYLFGTYHGTYDILYQYTDSIPELHQASNACSQFAGESETTSKPTPAQVGAAIKLPKDTTYADLLNKEDFHFLDSIVRQSLKSPLNKVYIKPNFLALILGEIEKGKKLVDTGYSQSRIDSMKSQVMDIALEKKAKEKGLTIVGLEGIFDAFVSEKSNLDLIAVKVLRRDCPDFLFPLKMMEIDGETEIRYELTDGVRFCYMPTQMKKREFIELLINLLQPFKACSDWFLDYHNFVLDENYILVGKNEQSVKYIYVPTKSQTNSDQEIMSFFAGLILKMDIKDDQSYTVDLLRVIKSPNANLMTLLEHLQKDQVEKKAAPAALAKPAEDHMKKIVSFVQDIPEKMAEKKEKQESALAEKVKAREQGTRPGVSAGVYGKSDEENRLINNLFGDDEPDKKKDKKKKEKLPKEKAPKEKGAGLFGFLKGKKKEEEEPEDLLAGYKKAAEPEKVEFVPKWESMPAPKPVSAPSRNEDTVEAYRSYSQEGDGDDSTAIAGDGELDDNRVIRLRLEDCAGCTCPKFIEIDLRKGHATIGRMDKNGEPCSDYNFEAAVSFVSRRHFRIEPSGNEWQIIDIGSSNGTIVSGENLTPNMPHTLKRNDTIMIVCKKRFMIYRVC